MKIATLRNKVLSAAFALTLLVSGVFAAEVRANTGFVDNSYSKSSPYGFTWSNTNGAPLDATDTTVGMVEFNYTTTSGSDWNTSLGQPTTYDGAVAINALNANVRADKNTALIPPQYGVFSGEFMTDPTNPFFSQPIDPNYWYVNSDGNTNGAQMYDTLQQGVNNQQPVLGQTGQINVNNNGAAGFLPPTSVVE
jgi:hypothetical protein